MIIAIMKKMIISSLQSSKEVIEKIYRKIKEYMAGILNKNNKKEEEKEALPVLEVVQSVEVEVVPFVKESPKEIKQGITYGMIKQEKTWAIVEVPIYSVDKIIYTSEDRGVCFEQMKIFFEDLIWK